MAVLLTIALMLVLILAFLLLASIISWGLTWAMLVPKQSLPAILQKNHTDWWGIFSWIPRRFNAFVGGLGEPVQLLGSNPPDHNQDVPAMGTWCLSWPLYLAYTGARVFGVGIRWDYIDHYWVLRASWHRND